jgi:hypothetical protein
MAVRIYPLPLLLPPLSFPTAAEVAAGPIVVRHTTRGRIFRLPFPNQQEGTGLATSTPAVAAASMATAASVSTTLSLVDEYLSMVEPPGLKRGMNRDGGATRGGYVEVLMKAFARRRKDLQLQLCLLLTQSRKEVQPLLKLTSVTFKLVIKE